jgi:hypothetical protein
MSSNIDSADKAPNPAQVDIQVNQSLSFEERFKDLKKDDQDFEKIDDPVIKANAYYSK